MANWTSPLLFFVLTGSLLQLLPPVAHSSPVQYTFSGNYSSVPIGLTGSAFSGSFTYNPLTQKLSTISSLQLDGSLLPYSGYTAASNGNFFLNYSAALFNASVVWNPLTPSNDASTLYVTPSEGFVTTYHALSITFTPSQDPATPVPAPPAWLMMLTGLGILIPLYRRHVKAQRKGDDGAKGLAV